MKPVHKKLHTLVLSAVLLPAISYADNATSYSASFDQSAFVPDIALIVDMSYVNRNIKDDAQESLSLLGNEYPEYVEFNTNNGFNLNYAELTLHSDVDQNFELDGVFHFSSESVEIEEAYFTSKSLPYNLKLKGGKFKSDFGYLNNKHQHVWDFADAPLVYTTFLTAEGLNNVGLQLQSLLPTPWYMMAGVELLQGGNGASFSNDSFGDIQQSSAPALGIAYLKNSIDIEDTTLLLGLSLADGVMKSEEKNSDAHSTIYGSDLLVKSYFNSYSYLSWESEVMLRDLRGSAADSDVSINNKTFGGYSQLIYAYNQNWHTGLRYDALIDNPDESPLDKYTVMAEYLPSEFTRLRAQYSHSNAFLNANSEIQALNEFILELNIAIGAHGAHAF